MTDINSICMAAGAILALAATVTLLFKNEGVRGAGRIVSGLAWLAMGAGVLSTNSNEVTAWGLLLAGLVTTLSGVRKYRRRHLA
ncbi:MAG TPA: hypothetical protein PLC15_16130 [Candidatus Obscuribacter sp.]|nr:hypothetical protein [Candidatus Obscuribacter sp.]HND05820.1 hypothetical protein [Candidatus Obscuribacter sp.]